MGGNWITLLGRNASSVEIFKERRGEQDQDESISHRGTRSTGNRYGALF